MDAQQDILNGHIADLLRELKAVRESDGETMFMIATLAGRMLVDARLPTWSLLKAGLTATQYDQLLETTRTQGNDLFEEGEVRAAFALDVIVTSIVGSRFAAPRIVEGVALIDEMIERAVSRWRTHNAPTLN